MNRALQILEGRREARTLRLPGREPFVQSRNLSANRLQLGCLAAQLRFESRTCLLVRALHVFRGGLGPGAGGLLDLQLLAGQPQLFLARADVGLQSLDDCLRRRDFDSGVGFDLLRQRLRIRGCSCDDLLDQCRRFVLRTCAQAFKRAAAAHGRLDLVHPRPSDTNWVLWAV